MLKGLMLLSYFFSPVWFLAAPRTTPARGHKPCYKAKLFTIHEVNAIAYEAANGSWKQAASSLIPMKTVSPSLRENNSSTSMPALMGTNR